MGKPVNEITLTKLQPTLAILAEAGVTTDHFDRLRADPEYRSCVVEALLYTPPSTKPTGMDTASQIERIISWYAEYPRIALTAEEIRSVLPERQPEFDRLIVVASGMSHHHCAEALSRQCSVWRYNDDLSTSVASVRTEKLYAVWCRNRREADSENRNQPADSFQQNDCLTLEERLIYEGLYFAETGRNLDEKHWTICAGSRDGVNVLCVSWDQDDQKVLVDWSNPSDQSSDSAVRSVVSL